MPENANWIIVGSPENFRATRDHDFAVQGLKSRHRKTAEKVRPGDRIAWYITGAKAIAGTATITSQYYEDHTPIWKSTNKQRSDEDYPYRFEIKPDIILDEGEYIDAEPVARQLRHVSKWPAKNWTLAFQGNVRAVGDDDFAIVEAAVRDAARTSSPAGD